VTADDRRGRRALGLDGTRGGWVAVLLVDGAVADIAVGDRVDALRARAGHDVPTAVDIPIGLVDAPRRDADVAARAALPGAASSVFSAPCRAVVDAYRAGGITDFDAANALSRMTCGMGLSRQTWGIVDKVAEVDALVAAGAPLHEVHPELSFRLLVGRRLAAKRTWNGLRVRLAALEARGVVLPPAFDGGHRVAVDDVVDAAMVAWTADGVHRRPGLRSHPAVVRQFDHGRPIAIWTRP
jgi:predicted RNase H-like nuclease